jgi:hypothetical protein
MDEIIEELKKVKRFNDSLFELWQYWGVNCEHGTSIMFMMSDLSEKITVLFNRLKDKYPKEEI